MTTTLSPRRTTAFDASPRRGPIAVPLAAFLVISSAAAPLLAGLQSALNVPPDALMLTQFATAFGALAVFAVTRGRPTAPPPRPRPLVPAIGGVVALAALYAAAVWVGAAVTGQTTAHSVALSTPLPLVVALQFIGAFGEEVGWRGVVQPMLETRMSVLRAATVTGLLFGAGHWFVLGSGVVTYLLFVVGAVLLSWGFAAVTLGMRWWQRALIATALHWLVNVSLIVLPIADVAGAIIAVEAGSLVIGLASLPVLFRAGRAANLERRRRPLAGSGQPAR